MLLQLKMHRTRKCVLVHGFDRDEDGEVGEIEASQKVLPGDILIDINGKSLERRPFKEVLKIIRMESQAGGPRVLSLLRFLSTESEEIYLGEGSEAVMLRDRCFSVDGGRQ
jgi:hypothetical protein